MTGSAASAVRRASHDAGVAAVSAPSWLAHVRDVVARAEDAAGSGRTGSEGKAVAMLRPLFEDIVWLGALASDVTARLQDNPHHLFGLTALQSGALRQVLLASGARVSLTVGVLASRAWHPAVPPQTYSFGGSRTLFRLLSPDPAEGMMASAALGGAPCRAWPHIIAPGEILDLDEARDALAILPAESETLFLRARIRRIPAPLVTSQAPGEVAPRRSANGDDGLARSLAIVEMLRALDRKPPVDALRQLLPRARGVQRWTIMREMLASDTGAAWPDLMAMAEGEDDPGVRSAAAALILRLSSAYREVA